MAATLGPTSDNQPHPRFVIYDSDLSCSDSDSEIDTEEWVSVSSSTTTTTVSSLPQHLNLSLKPKSASVKPVNKLRQEKTTFKSQFPCAVPAGSNRYEDQHRCCSEGQRPLTVLKCALPNLSTIYVVDPKRLPNPQWTNQSPMELFHKNQYARICARCAKPQVIMSCDGTWETVGGGICDLHTNFMRMYRDKQISKCGGGGKDMVLDQIGALLEVVQPFERSCTIESGIQVFDMSVPSDTTKFVHKDGCQHY